MDPAQPSMVLCAPELIYRGTEGESLCSRNDLRSDPTNVFP